MADHAALHVGRDRPGQVLLERVQRVEVAALEVIDVVEQVLAHQTPDAFADELVAGDVEVPGGVLEEGLRALGHHVGGLRAGVRLGESLAGLREPAEDEVDDRLARAAGDQAMARSESGLHALGEEARPSARPRAAQRADSLESGAVRLGGELHQRRRPRPLRRELHFAEERVG